MKIANNILLGYIEDIYACGVSIVAASKGGKKSIPVPMAMNKAVSLCREVKRKNNKIIFIGNGGSASIASHQAVDFWKNGKIRALSFNDSSLLTCISNDFGYEHVFAKPVEMFSQKGDLIVAISSSGRSKNILNAVKCANKKGCKILTLSGFSKNNPLRTMGDVNFYVPSYSYGIVEILHLGICHSLLDYIIKQR